MERRNFFKNLGAALAAMQFLPELAQALSERIQKLSADVFAAPDERSLWSRVRREFMLDPDLIHLNCGTVGAVPRLVLDVVASSMREIEGNPQGNTFGGLADGMEIVRQKAAEFLGAQKDEIVLTRNTTEGMNTVVSGLHHLGSGDEMLTTNHEHGGGMVSWQHLAKHRGIKIRQIKMPAPVPHKAQILQLIEDHITPRTKACMFSHVETFTGLQMPLADIAQITRPRGILLFCDGAQAPGMLDIDVKALGVDTYASSSHKWMLAPKGSGLLYIRKEIGDLIQPIFTYSGHNVYSASSGTRNVSHILGHGATMDFHNAIGRDRIEARCRQLSAHMRLSILDDKTLRQYVRLLTPNQREISSGIVSFALDPDKISNSALNTSLSQRDIVIKTLPSTYSVDGGVPAESYNAIRLSTHIFNSEAEIERAVAAMADVLKG